jgi:hypothetical protein
MTMRIPGFADSAAHVPLIVADGRVHAASLRDAA